MNIRKIRVIPRGFKEYPAKKEISEAFSSVNRGELFMRLYSLVGKPDDNLDYLLRFDKYAVLISKDGDDRLWVSPAMNQLAEKRRVKTINVMARRANLDNVAFITDEPVKLFFVVNQKNNILLDKVKTYKSEKEIKDSFLEYIGDSGKEKIYGSMTQYIPEVNEALKELVETINNTL